MIRHLFILLFSFCLLSCDNDGSDTPIELEEPNLCEFCDYSNDELPFLRNDSLISEPIDQPIAISFFNLYETIYKYDECCPDSLPEKCRNDGRQTIYRAFDLVGMHRAFVIPVLEKIQVPELEGDINAEQLAFKQGDDYLIIDLTYFIENDGVILYQPNKVPVFWNMKSGSRECDDEAFIKCYFSN